MPVAAASIQAMLFDVRHEREQLESRLAVLMERENTLRAWLTEEGPVQAELPVGGIADGTPLSNFLRTALADGKAHSVADLGRMAEAKGGLIKSNSSPGRVIHFALVGLSQHGSVERTGDGLWRLKK